MTTEQSANASSLGSWGDFLEYLPMPATIQAQDFSFVRVNRALCELLGYTADQLVGTNAARLMTPDTRPRADASRAALLRLKVGETIVSERHNRCANGDIVIHKVRTRHIRGPDGNTFFLSLTEDVSELLRAEEVLRREAQWHKVLFENSPIPQLLLDTGYHIREVNAALCEYSGLDASRLLGKDPAVLLDNEVERQEILQTRGKVDWARSSSYRTRVRTFVRPDGRTLHFYSVVRYTQDPHGTDVIILTLFDLTDEVHYREELERLVAQQLAILETTTAGVAYVQGNRISRANSSFEQLFGYAQDVLQHTDPALIFGGQDRWGEFMAGTRRQSAMGRAHTEEMLLRGGDGSLRNCEVTSRVAVVDDEETSVIITVHDITQIRQIESRRMNDAVAQRDALIREVHHHIKNNLQGVVGLLYRDAAAKPQISEPLMGATSRIQAISEIFGLKALAGQVNLIALLRTIANNLAEVFDVQVLTAHDDAGDADVSLVERETVPLALIINELITNAIKHRSRDGTVSIRTVRTLGQAAIEIRITGTLATPIDLVRDRLSPSGIGLVAAMLPRRGAQLVYDQEQGMVKATLTLAAPVIQIRG